MDIGLMHVTPNSSADPAKVAKRAEELGFESYWVGDHTIVPVHSSIPYPGAKHDGQEPFYVSQLPDPFIALARAGATTSRIKLGTGICLVPERNPILAAKQVATLDDACGGRFLFGIGAGWNREESTILGGDFDHRWSQIKDYIAAMKELWQDELSEYHGRWVDFPPVKCFPKPARKPHPPVLIGSISSPHALKRVAEWGDGWIPVVSTVEQFAAGVTEVKALAKAAGRNPDGFDFTVFALEQQWRTKPELKALQQAGANRVVLWILRHDLKSILEELEELAQKVLG